MKKKSALQTLSKDNRYLVNNFFIAYFVMGLYLILIGSALPSIQAEYHLSYRVGGMMLSVQSAGYLAVGAIVGIAARRMGAKMTYLILSNLVFVGLVLIMVTGNPAVLLLAMLMTGISKGCTANFGNQFVSVLTNSDGGVLNLAQAFFAVGACVAPLIAMACGASWRTAFVIAVAFGVLNMFYALRMKVGADAYQPEQSGKPDFGFFKEKLFWLCAMIMLCYMSVEASVMGWLVTFFVDSGAADNTTAQLLSTALWGALLVGRLASAWLSSHFRPYQMIAVMTGGIAVCFTLLIFGRSMLPMAVGAMGLGLFMAGVYGTALANGGDLTKRYPMCMGMYIVIPGIGATAAPGAIGMLADRIGIRGGMAVLYVLVVLLIAATVLNVLYQKKHEKPL